MICEHRTITLSTMGNDHIVDLTGELTEAVRTTGLETGQVVAMVQGSTAALTTLEFEPGLVNLDIAAAMERLAPRDGYYLHEETWHDDNGHSHVRAALIGPSLTVPFVEGQLTLGTWQQIVFLDLDTSARSRRLVLQILGE